MPAAGPGHSGRPRRAGAAVAAGSAGLMRAAARAQSSSPSASAAASAAVSPAVAASPETGTGASAVGSRSAALVVTRPPGDRGAIDDMVAALARAGADLDLATSMVTVTDPAGHEAAIRRLAQSGTDVIAVTFEAADHALGVVAAEFPGTRFIGIGGGADAAPLPNMTTVTF